MQESSNFNFPPPPSMVRVKTPVLWCRGMATKIEASRLLIYSASAKRDRRERCDLEAGMAKLFATETAAEVSLEAMRIMGGNGFSKDFPVERYYRDASYCRNTRFRRSDLLRP